MLPAANSVGSPSVWRFGDWTSYEVMHYQIWDSVVIRPGEILQERLLPPPVPDDFLITHISIVFPAQSSYKSLSEVCRNVVFSLRDGERRIMETPLFNLPAFPPWGLPRAYRHIPGQDLGIYLHSLEAIPSEDPITVSVILQGMIPAR